MIEFTVFGTPIPQGSMKAFNNPKTGFASITSDNAKLKPWRKQVAEAASRASANHEAFLREECAIEIRLAFYFERPKSVSERKRPNMTAKPDIDKLLRAVLDALKDVLFKDDALVCRVFMEKHYGAPERVDISVMRAI